MQFLQKITVNSRTALHFFGCSWIALVSVTWGASLLASFAIAAILGLVWEILDAMNQARGWKIPILDPKGGDIVDFVIDLLGAAFAILIAIL